MNLVKIVVQTRTPPLTPPKEGNLHKEHKILNINKLHLLFAICYLLLNFSVFYGKNSRIVMDVGQYFV